MRTRPARLDSTNRLRVPTPSETTTATPSASPATSVKARRGRAVSIALVAAAIAIGSAAPVSAEERAWAWDWSVPQRIASTGVDLAIVRPLAAARAGVGAILLVPATILASPGCVVNLITGADCRPIFEAPYEVLVAEPAEYAFERELGEL